MNGARRAIVTGTSRGLGEAVARALLDRGWSVLGIARGAAPASLAHEHYRHERLDLAEVEAAIHALGRLERELALGDCERVALVSNAGVVEPVGSVADVAPAELARAFAVNAVAPLALAGWVIARAKLAKLRIVNVSSGAAQQAYPGWMAYCASKAALAMGSRVIAADAEEMPSLAGIDLAVVDYAPGVVATAMQGVVREQESARFPRRARFVELFERGELVAPDAPAGEIAELVERDDLPLHSACRYPIARSG